MLHALRLISVLSVLTFFFSGCTLLVNVMSFFPERSSLEDGKIPENCSVDFIPAGKNIRLETWFFPCTSSTRLLIFFHGNAGNIRQRLPDLIRLHRNGINVLGFSYRGYGASSGRPSEKGIYRDGEAVLRFAMDSLGFSVDNIVLMGRSIGTTSVVNTAHGRQLAGIILVTPLLSGRDHAHFHGIGWLSFFAGNCFDNLSKVRELKAPVLIIHGTNDETISFEHGRKLYEAIPTRKRFVAIKGGFHNNLEFVNAEKYWGAIRNFLDAT